jgi:hypothetical protein
LVDNPKDVVVTIKTNEEKKIVVSLKVNEKDVGKVIGKKGRTAKALRTLVMAVAAKEGKAGILEIEDQK